MNELIIVNKKLNFYEKIILKKSLYKNNIVILDFTYDKNSKFYSQNNITDKLVKKNILNNKNFFLIERKFKKKIKKILKKYPEYIEYKFTEFNLSDFWWKLIFKVETINYLYKKKKMQNIKVFEKLGSNLSLLLSPRNKKKINTY